MSKCKICSEYALVDYCLLYRDVVDVEKEEEDCKHYKETEHPESIAILRFEIERLRLENEQLRTEKSIYINIYMEYENEKTKIRLW